jgi:ubiquinone/menaquinone biosynthesis C-methylase UbiE
METEFQKIDFLENNSVKHIYNQIATHFDSTRHYRWQWITEFISSNPIGSTIYDIGCGNGRNMLYPNYNFIGVDNSESFVKICLEKGLNVFYAEMDNLPYTSNSCDAIINIAAFHHLASIERRLKTLNEMNRVLRPDGKILISVWSKNQPKKTKRVFENYGVNLVPWKKPNNKQNVGEDVKMRFYYIFKIEELLELFDKVGLSVLEHKWDCGNEVFILQKD